jgi:transcriptional regulator of aromatic amino acid metabolism
VLSSIGSTAPADRASTVFSAVLRACPIRDARGKDRWPINPCACTPESLAWAAIFGIEAGWFERNRFGFVQWSMAGRGLWAERNTVAGALLRAKPSAWF